MHSRIFFADVGMDRTKLVPPTFFLSHPRRIHNFYIHALSMEFFQAFQSLVDSIVAGKPPKDRGSVTTIKYEVVHGLFYLRVSIHRTERLYSCKTNLGAISPPTNASPFQPDR